MKHYLTPVLLLLAGCTSSEEVEQPNLGKVEQLGYTVAVVDYAAAGMHYKVFKTSGAGVFVVNVTLDSLRLANLTNND